MDPLHTAVLLGLFVVLLALGIPIAVGIGLTSLGALLLGMDAEIAFTTVAQRMATGLDRFTLLAIPFFILSGVLMNRGGIARRLIDLARAMVGMLPGGLAYVNIGRHAVRSDLGVGGRGRRRSRGLHGSADARARL